MLAGVDGSQRDDGVGIGGGANENRVNLGVVDNIHVVGGNVGDAAGSAPVARAGLVDHRVSDCNDLYAGDGVDQVVDVQLADTAAANDANLQISHNTYLLLF